MHKLSEALSPQSIASVARSWAPTWILLLNVLFFVPYQYLAVTAMSFWGVAQFPESPSSAFGAIGLIVALIWCAHRDGRVYLILQSTVSVLGVTVFWFNWKGPFITWLHRLPFLVLVVGAGGLALLLSALLLSRRVDAADRG